MLLLYPIMRGVFFRHSIPFTFHYASTLSYFLICPAGTITNLHSTMLLLYLTSACPSKSIPLNLHSTMLLLYPMSDEELLAKALNLHSTMLLLYLIPCVPVNVRDIIYIPLCFYFICGRGGCFRASGNIYIPLCFYFIR